MIDYFKRTLSTLQKAIISLDERQFLKLLDDCCYAVSNGNKIIVSGLGKNVPICEKFIGTLNSFSIDAAFLHTNSAIHGDLGIIKDNDVVILLSKSGATAETLILLSQIEKRRPVDWCITFERTSELFRRCENGLALEIDNEGDKWNIVPNNSTAIYLIVLQGLAIMLADRLGVTLEDFRINHPGGYIGEVLKASNAGARVRPSPAEPRRKAVLTVLADRKR